MSDQAGREQTRQLNVRVNGSLLDQVTAVSIVDGTTLSAVVREALELLVEQRKGDAGWQQRRQNEWQRHLRTLAPDTAPPKGS